MCEPQSDLHLDEDCSVHQSHQRYQNGKFFVTSLTKKLDNVHNYRISTNITGGQAMGQGRTNLILERGPNKMADAGISYFN